MKVYIITSRDGCYSDISFAVLKTAFENKEDADEHVRILNFIFKSANPIFTRCRQETWDAHKKYYDEHPIKEVPNSAKPSHKTPKKNTPERVAWDKKHDAYIELCKEYVNASNERERAVRVIMQKIENDLHAEWLSSLDKATRDYAAKYCPEAIESLIYGGMDIDYEVECVEVY